MRRLFRCRYAPRRNWRRGGVMICSGTYARAAADIRTGSSVIELQSLRGIAALIVVVYHCALYYDYGAASRSAMSLIFNAHGAVVTFFVLSGFVLTLSLMRSPLDRRRIGFFYIRRAFRIYPALWTACALALIYLLVFGADGVALGSEWARMNCGNWPLPTGRIMLAFAGLKSTLPLPIWSLAVELVASAAMPFLILVMRRSVPAFVILTLGLAVLSRFGGDKLLLIPTYMIDFALGASVALVVPQLRVALRRRGMLAVCAGAGVALLWTGRAIAGADFELAYHDPLTSMIEGVGAALVIGAIFVRADRFSILSARWATRLGDRSYSLYLLHQPVLAILAATGALLVPRLIVAHPGAATLVLIAGTIALAMPLATLGFQWIELPAIGIGQRLVRRLEHFRSPDRRVAAAMPR
ncbi:acyltransferase [Sphingomonas sp. KR1UV-12]|uniref:Acyltransferase n=1 Tax=Sphingomonas aurea TaxID=3063994 RepID=A0ABT9EKH1_9SPHN|nr:acyltransferase [Sphingomonas sp. KR1UV-12]MDP1027446.1 acyltransferase [Sphingomonas sp. KR1UV-12]